MFKSVLSQWKCMGWFHVSSYRHCTTVAYEMTCAPGGKKKALYFSETLISLLYFFHICLVTGSCSIDSYHVISVSSQVQAPEMWVNSNNQKIENNNNKKATLLSFCGAIYASINRLNSWIWNIHCHILSMGKFIKIKTTVWFWFF